MDSRGTGGPKITSIEDVTPEWLSSTLGILVEDFTSSRIGTGQVSWTYRLALSTAASNSPTSVVLKVASSDPASRHSALSLGIYEKEVRFYQELSPTLDKLGSLAKCYHASWDPINGTFALLLHDVQAEPGNDIKGATIEQARAAVIALGRIQGDILRNEEALKVSWLDRKSPSNQGMMEALFAGFVERYRDRLKPEHLNICKTLIGSCDAWQQKLAGQNDRKGLVHGDYRLDNMLFNKNDELTVVDWQTILAGPVMADFAYFVGGSLKTEDRRNHLEELLSLYISAIGKDAGITRDVAERGLREQTFYGVFMCIASPMLVERTERGDTMFMVMIERHCTAVLDLEALALLPKAEIQVPLQPKQDDEHPHSPGTEELWNESWYFDLVDEKSGVGVYVRLGLYPNMTGSWYTAVISHPKRGLLAVTDYQCPHPKEDLVVQTARFRATQKATIPLQEYQVTLQGISEEFADPADVLRGQKGKDVPIEMDVLWKTDGVPYQWKMTSRYEIPCRATGKVAIDGEEITFKDVVAQRDHSHGVRDWWGADWMWCAFHLHDGTRIHGADLRMPQIGRLSVGYIQGPKLSITELSKCRSDEIMAANRLPDTAQVTLEYGESGSFTVEVNPVGHGPLRLVAPDGRVSNFTRCWAQLKCSDGRTGVGWIEWNHNSKVT